VNKLNGTIIVGFATVIINAGTVGAQAPRVPVFVTSAGAANGFTDPSKDNQNTVQDLRNAMKDDKAIELVDRREAAKVVIVVQGRDTAQLTAGVFGGAARDPHRSSQVHRRRLRDGNDSFSSRRDAGERRCVEQGSRQGGQASARMDHRQ
jgi:hypothetical protein